MIIFKTLQAHKCMSSCFVFLSLPTFAIRVSLLPQQIEYLTAQYTTAKNKVLSELDSKLNSCCLLTLFVQCLYLHVAPCVYLCIAVVLSFYHASPFWSCPPDIGPLLGGRIHSQLEKEVVPSLDTALRMAGGNSQYWAADPGCSEAVVLDFLKSRQLNLFGS